MQFLPAVVLVLVSVILPIPTFTQLEPSSDGAKKKKEPVPVDCSKDYIEYIPYLKPIVGDIVKPQDETVAVERMKTILEDICIYMNEMETTKKVPTRLDWVQLFERKNWQLYFPGTKWCGEINEAKKLTGLSTGIFAKADKCCRKHDMCEDTIDQDDCEGRVCNKELYAMNTCNCDAKFHRCLKTANDTISRLVGTRYFDGRRMKCFSLRHPMIGCVDKPDDVFDIAERSMMGRQDEKYKDKQTYYKLLGLFSKSEGLSWRCCDTITYNQTANKEQQIFCNPSFFF